MSGQCDVDLKVDWCSYKAAKYAVENWHYSKTIPANKSNRFGIWENSIFIGSIIYGLGASPSLGKPYGLNIFETCELTRIALNGHSSCVSLLIAITLRLVKKRNPKLRLCISFADPYHEHYGGIYQAANWIYSGATKGASKMIMLLDGSLIDPRRYNGHGHNRASPMPAGAKELSMPSKHRYLYPLDKAMRRQIEKLRQPYPKRAATGGTS